TLVYKIHLIKECLKRNIPRISSMSAANKMEPTRLRVKDLFERHTDPRAKIIRTKLRKEGYKKGVPVVFSDESPIVIREDVRKTVGNDKSEIRKAQMPPASNACVPSTTGLIMACYVFQEIVKGIHIQRLNDEKKYYKS